MEINESGITGYSFSYHVNCGDKEGVQIKGQCIKLNTGLILWIFI